MGKVRNTLIFQEQDTLITDALEEYLLALRAGHRSERTIEFYESNIQRFIWWLRKSNLGEKLNDIQASHIRLFITYLQDREHRWASDAPQSNRKVADTTVQAYFRALRAFFNFCQREDLGSDNPFDNRRIQVPKVRKTIKPTYDESELAELLAACDAVGVNGGLRDKAILYLLIDTGIRASELCDLHLCDLEKGRVKVVGKGNKERYLPLSPSAEKAIRDYARRGRREARCDRLFVSRDGEPLLRNGLYQMIKRRCKQAGIEDIGVHKFRHTSAKLWLDGGGPLHGLQAMLGHESSTMSLEYARIFSNDVDKLHKQFSPVERLGLRIGRAKKR